MHTAHLIEHQWKSFAVIKHRILGFALLYKSLQYVQFQTNTLQCPQNSSSVAVGTVWVSVKAVPRTGSSNSSRISSSRSRSSRSRMAKEWVETRVALGKSHTGEALPLAKHHTFTNAKELLFPIGSYRILQFCTTPNTLLLLSIVATIATQGTFTNSKELLFTQTNILEVGQVILHYIPRASV